MRSVLSKNAWLSSLLFSFSALSYADFQADAGFASEYVRQGIKQSSAKPVLQGNVLYTSQTGLYGGIWGTGVERGSPDSTALELDGFVGFYFPVNDNVALDVGYMRATFFGEKTTDDDTYGEGFFNLLLNQSTTFGYRYSPDFLGSGEDLQTLEAAQLYTYGDFTFEGSVRQYQYLETTDTVNWGSESRDDYFHFRLGISRSYYQHHMALGLERTNLSSEFDGGTQIVFTYSRQFDF